MSQIQSVLYTETLHDLQKASALFSSAEYDTALPILLRRLPLLDSSYLKEANTAHGNALLARVYLKLHKNREALSTLEKSDLRERFQPIYLYTLMKNRNFSDLVLLTIHATQPHSSRLFCTFQQLIAQLYLAQFEESLLEIRSLLSNLQISSIHDWALIRSFYFELEDEPLRFSPEVEEAAKLMQKEIEDHLRQQWYSSHQLHDEWKEAFIDMVTDTFAPATPIPSDSSPQLFAQPISFEFEWTLDKLLANMDEIPTYEISKTIGPLL